MAGEIRAKMEELRRARLAMVAGISKEIDAVKEEVRETHVDGLDAMKLPRAELDATRQEIREIRAEFAPASNGGPPGPLSGTETSADSSATSAQSAPAPAAIKVSEPIAAGGVIRLPTEDAANGGS